MNGRPRILKIIPNGNKTIVCAFSICNESVKHQEASNWKYAWSYIPDKLKVDSGWDALCNQKPVVRNSHNGKPHTGHWS